MFYWCARPKAAICAAAAKWRFVRSADIHAWRSESQLTAHSLEKLTFANAEIAVPNPARVKRPEFVGAHQLK